MPAPLSDHELAAIKEALDRDPDGKETMIRKVHMASLYVEVEALRAEVEALRAERDAAIAKLEEVTGK